MIMMMMMVMMIQLDNKFDAAKAYVDASHCFNKTSRKGAYYRDLNAKIYLLMIKHNLVLNIGRGLVAIA